MINRMIGSILVFILTLLSLFGCANIQGPESPDEVVSTSENMEAADDRIPILIDTDANNELDDQHALAYALFNADVFNVVGVTVNHTVHVEGTLETIQGDYDEALRILSLCKSEDAIPLMTGAEFSYEETLETVDQPDFQGHEAVNFIIEQAKVTRDQKLVLVPIGKLTNIALAFHQDPSIVPLVKVVWLGGNYYEKDGVDGEHNLSHDQPAYNAVIETGVEFEMVTVRYGSATGTAAVTVSIDEIKSKMPGSGPVTEPIIGRHGGDFSTFGDYSVELFENYTSGTRPLFDLVALAIIKNPEWAQVKEIPAPRLEYGFWSGTFPDQTIKLWENFDRDGIIEDFYNSVDNPHIIK